MTERQARISAFLAAAGWQNAGSTPIAGDVSPRRYSRISQDGRTAVLMDADTPMHAFANVTEWLRAADLSAPAILAEDAENGLLLLEDFGSTSVKALLVANADEEADIFEECIELLRTIRRLPPPDLARPNAASFVEWTTLTDDHYPGIRPDLLNGFRLVLRDALEDALATPATVSLRDFHTENLMWLPDRQGHLRLGLLDYQDAFLTHPVYDLMSLLTDARRPVSRARRDMTIERYLAKTSDDPHAFRTAFDIFSAQRNLRILGIFARAGKHIAHMPSVYGYFREALENTVFDTVRDDVLQAVPVPS